jgi:predicted lipid-binding transport protein (Tim44 family)
VPADFDAEGFLAAKRNFVTLQAAWDRGDITTLRSMMTDEMLPKSAASCRARSPARRRAQPHRCGDDRGPAAGHRRPGQWLHGQRRVLRHDPRRASAGPSPFREVWNMTKPKSNSSGWLVAGAQALQ